MRAVIVTTEYRGVFFGYVPDDIRVDTNSTLSLNKAKMAICWGTDKGLMQLCSEGPNSNSKISSEADILALHKVTAVFAVTKGAEEKWKSA